MKINTKSGIFLALSLFLALVFFRWGIVFIVPGILLIYFLDREKRDLPMFCAFVLASSISFWIVSFWLLKYINISLSNWACLITIFTILAIIPFKDANKFRFDMSDRFVLIVLALVMAMRFLPMFFQAAPAGADMSMHSYMARLILENNGVPNSYEPILPIKGFGAYAAGFQTLMAMVSMLGGVSILKAGLIVSFFTHFLVSVGLYGLLRLFFDKRVSIATAALLPFALIHPQSFIRWGGNPTILALFFLIMALALIERSKEKVSVPHILITGLLFSACPLTHIIPTLGFAYAVMPFIAYQTIKLEQKERINLAINLFAAALVSAVLLTPYLANFLANKIFVTQEMIAEAKNWQKIDLVSTYRNLAAAMPIIMLSIYGAVRFIKRDKPIFWRYTLLLLSLFLLLMNRYLFILPASAALYPSRIMLIMILPLSIFCAEALNSLKGDRWFKAVIAVFAVISIAYYCHAYVYSSIKLSAVTSADIKAFEWMDNYLSKNAIIANNYGDAGLWIPAAAFRKITNPHIFDALKSGLKGAKPFYIYIGSKKVYDNIEYKYDTLLKQPGKYKLIYSKDGAGIFRILK